ncbi:MAG: TonB-dependent receptor, partial [Chitinophaga rupis]
KWETTRQFNIGLAGSLISRRLTFEFDYYDKYTNDLLLPAPVPNISGFTSIVSNVGAMSNKGVELSLHSINIQNKLFSWNTSFTISHNKNKVEKLLIPITDGSYGMYQIQQGHPLYSIYAFHELGVDPKTGNVIDEDVSGPNGKPDGKITADDKKIVGDIWPKFEGAFKNTLTYKGFFLDVNVVYRSGNKVFNYTRYFLEAGGTRGVTRSIQKSSLNYWKKPGDVGVLPRPTSLINADGSANYNSSNGFSSRFLENASYIRVRDITLGYDLPRNLAYKLKFTNIHLYATASNLFTITKYTGPDPEANNSGDSGSIVQGLDFNTTPQPKTIVVGINLTL